MAAEKKSFEQRAGELVKTNSYAKTAEILRAEGYKNARKKKPTTANVVYAVGKKGGRKGTKKGPKGTPKCSELVGAIRTLTGTLTREERIEIATAFLTEE